MLQFASWQPFQLFEKTTNFLSVFHGMVLWFQNCLFQNNTLLFIRPGARNPWKNMQLVAELDAISKSTGQESTGKKCIV
jgi:hypothetical protein